MRTHVVRANLPFPRAAALAAVALASLACSKPSGHPPGATSANAAAHAAPEPPLEEEADFGSKLDDKEFEAAVTVLPPSALRKSPGPRGDLPPHVVLTNLPSIAAQGTPKHRGSPGSCEAQSFGRGLGTYTAARALDGHVLWDASKPENEASAAFLYAWQHHQSGAKCGSGSAAIPYLGRLVAAGAPNAVEVPYKPECPYLDGAGYVAMKYPDEARLRIGSFATLRFNPKKLALVKELLAAGHAIAFSGPVIKGYGNPTLEDGVLYTKETVPASGHGQLLVGYDDAKGKQGKQGAFLVQNSNGADWPPAAPGGRVWIAYDTFLETQKLGAVAYPRDPSPVGGHVLTEKTAKGKHAPAAAVTRAYQWEGDGATYLILHHHFAEPVLFKSITLKTPGGKAVTATIEQFMQAGYTHLRRTDGKSFLHGRWEITLHAETLAGDAVTYTGSVTVAKGARPPAPLTSPTYGPTEKQGSVH